MATQGYTQGGINGLGGQSGFRDPSLPADPGVGKSLWQSCPLLAQLCEPQVAYGITEDFTEGITKAADAWVATQATAGTATAGTLAGGTVALSSGATTQHEGIQIQLAGGQYIPAANKSIWFETRLQVNHLYGEFLFGLFDVDTTLVATGSLHATDGIGFQSLTSDGVVLGIVGSSSTFNSGVSVTTLVASTYVNLGFVVTSNTSVQFYLNGVAVGAAVTTHIPSVVLTPSFVSQAGSAAGANVITNVDWVKVVQLR